MNEKKIISAFKKNLQKYRKDRGYSQRELARKIGVSQRMVAYYEDNAIDIPLSKVEELADALEISIGELLDMKIKKQEEHTDLDVRLIRKIKQIQELPKRAQEALLHNINTTIEINAMKTKKK